MSDIEPKLTEVAHQSCGWRVKHGPHLGFDMGGDVVLSCPGSYEHPTLFDLDDVDDKRA